MALSFHQLATAPAFGHGALPATTDAIAVDVTSFLYDLHPEVSDALLGFVYDASPNNALDELLNTPDNAAAGFFTGPTTPGDDDKVEQHRDKKLRAACCVGDERYGLASIVDLGQQELYGVGGNQQVRGADETKHGGGNVQSAAARERRKRISRKTAELSRLIPGGHKMSTADMLQEAARHVRLLQAQVGMLALMHSVDVGSSELCNGV